MVLFPEVDVPVVKQKGGILEMGWKSTTFFGEESHMRDVSESLSAQCVVMAEGGALK